MSAGPGGIPSGVPDPEEPLRLGPGEHPPTEGGYRHQWAGNPVHVRAGAVGNPFAGGLGTWADPLIDSLLAGAGANPAISEATKALLPWALTSVAASTPDALGLYGPAKYSGPGPTGLIRNLGHRTRGEALAAELVVAACLVERPWPSTDGRVELGGLRQAGGRLDFGVKHSAGSTGRRTIESDVLVTSPSGRNGVDVKHSHGSYRHPPTQDVLAAVEQAINRAEIQSFHWATPTRFRPRVREAVLGHSGLHLHEGVWPTPDDRRRIELLQDQALDTNALVRAWLARAPDDVSDLAADLASAAGDAYTRAWGRERDLREIDLPDGFTYLFDTTATPAPHPPARLVAAWGLTGDRVQPRRPDFMRRFPLPPHVEPLDRGHIIARSSGGAEALGLNLIPQDRRTNRGWGDLGKGWRLLERMMASNPGAFVWRRITYDSPDDIPTQIESLVVIDRATPMLDVFTNRSSLRVVENAAPHDRIAR